MTITKTSDNRIDPGLGASYRNNANGLRSGFSVWSGWDTVGGTRHTIWLNGAPAYLDAANTIYHPSVDPNTGISFPSAPSRSLLDTTALQVTLALLKVQPGPQPPMELQL